MKMKQERPDWCHHGECIFKRSSEGLMCGGQLPKPTEHNGGINTYHFCLNSEYDSCYEVNDTDLERFRWIFDSLDGKRTSWLSTYICEKCGSPMTKVTEYTCDCGERK